MSIGSIICTVIIVGTGAATILLFCVGFVWGIYDAIREHKRIKRENAEAAAAEAAS